MLDAFEYVLNGYLGMENFDIYVTGSNSRFLSSDVITQFRGRGDEIHVMPLSFSEFYTYSGGDTAKRIDEYMTYGGLPRVVLSPTSEAKMNYLITQVEKTYIKDVIERHNLKNAEGLEELMNILASGISCLTNPTKIENRFKSEKKISLSADTINTYVGYLKESFILDSAVRYDIRGRHYISTPYKIYFEDLGLRNARLNFRQVEYTLLMKNLIYNELKIRGFCVDTGNIEIREGGERKNLEVDFVANNGNRRFYIQSAYDIPDKEKMEQEIKSLDKIPDSFRKIIVINRPMESKINEKGYLFLSLEDFLLKPESIYM